jgi:predicted nuclease of predicted toxin-antitoxin system
VSKDEDFRSIRLPDRFALLWLRCGNTTNRVLSAWLEARWTKVEGLLASGERMIELV